MDDEVGDEEEATASHKISKPNWKRWITGRNRELVEAKQLKDSQISQRIAQDWKEEAPHSSSHNTSLAASLHSKLVDEVRAIELHDIWGSERFGYTTTFDKTTRMVDSVTDDSFVYTIKDKVYEIEHQYDGTAFENTLPHTSTNKWRLWKTELTLLENLSRNDDEARSQAIEEEARLRELRNNVKEKSEKLVLLTSFELGPPINVLVDPTLPLEEEEEEEEEDYNTNPPHTLVKSLLLDENVVPKIKAVSKHRPYVPPLRAASNSGPLDENDNNAVGKLFRLLVDMQNVKKEEHKRQIAEIQKKQGAKEIEGAARRVTKGTCKTNIPFSKPTIDEPAATPKATHAVSAAEVTTPIKPTVDSAAFQATPTKPVTEAPKPAPTPSVEMCKKAVYSEVSQPTSSEIQVLTTKGKELPMQSALGKELRARVPTSDAKEAKKNSTNTKAAHTITAARPLPEVKATGLLALDSVQMSSLVGFGLGCDRQSHILYGMCLDGQCGRRAVWEKTAMFCNDVARTRGLKPSRNIRVVTDLSEEPAEEQDDETRANTRLALSLVDSSKDNFSALQMAVHLNDVQAIWKLQHVGKGVNNVIAASRTKQTVLHVAVQKRLTDAVEALIDCFADDLFIDPLDINDNTPLHIAAKDGELEIVKLLCDAGSCCEGKNKAGKMPVELAKSHQVFQIIKLSSDKISLVKQIQDLSRSRKIAEIAATKDPEISSTPLGNYEATLPIVKPSSMCSQLDVVLRENHKKRNFKASASKFFAEERRLDRAQGDIVKLSCLKLEPMKDPRYHSYILGSMPEMPAHVKRKEPGN